MKLIFADKDIPKLWERIQGKTYTELSYYETLCVKSNTDKFVRLGYIELPVNVKKQLWEQTAHITDPRTTQRALFRFNIQRIYKE